jgi:hypothetical protein
MGTARARQGSLAELGAGRDRPRYRWRPRSTTDIPSRASGVKPERAVIRPVSSSSARMVSTHPFTIGWLRTMRWSSTLST